MLYQRFMNAIEDFFGVGLQNYGWKCGFQSKCFFFFFLSKIRNTTFGLTIPLLLMPSYEFFPVKFNHINFLFSCSQRLFSTWHIFCRLKYDWTNFANSLLTPEFENDFVWIFKYFYHFYGRIRFSSARIVRRLNFYWIVFFLIFLFKRRIFNAYEIRVLEVKP